tara:strand:- start:365 stop:805 length:441 start_codon:yes stop_codon:yes gene_type:complete
LKTLDFLSEHIGISFQQSDSYGDWLGFEIDSVKKEENKVITSLLIRRDHVSPTGAVHGGVVSGFLDSSLGCAMVTIMDKGQMCSTVELNVKFFKPLSPRDKIIAESEVIHKGRTLCTVIANVYKSDAPDIPVALATATFNRYQLKQ